MPCVKDTYSDNVQKKTGFISQEFFIDSLAFFPWRKQDWICVVLGFGLRTNLFRSNFIKPPLQKMPNRSPHFFGIKLMRYHQFLSFCIKPRKESFLSRFFIWLCLPTGSPQAPAITTEWVSRILPHFFLFWAILAFLGIQWRFEWPLAQDESAEFYPQWPPRA